MISLNNELFCVVTNTAPSSFWSRKTRLPYISTRGVVRSTKTTSKSRLFWMMLSPATIYYWEGIIKRKNLRRGKYTFIHKTEFPCIKQAPGSTREAWYAIYHMREYVKDEQRLQYPSSLAKWCETLAESSDAEIRQEFGRIQQMIARTISRDVIHSDGVFFYSHRPLPNADIEARLHQHGDDRPFNSLQGCLPFPPPKPKPKKPKSSKK